MLSNTENHTQRITLPASMQVFFGKCHKKGIQTTPVVGRLVFDGSAYTHSGKEALLAVVGNDMSEQIFDDGRTVGIVRISDTCECSAPDIPCPSITLPALPRECGGRIALLDPLSERLFVSPDIVTVNKYAPLCCPSYTVDTRLPLILPSGKRISLTSIPDDPFVPSGNTEGYLLRPLGAESEEELYGMYRDIAERAVGQTVTAMLSARREPEVAMRALMRAAIWGEVSLLLCDILTEGELMAALERLHRVFCELEAEGREFNGYLPRGLCIDTPYLLSCAADLGGVDLFVYDAERIARLLCGERQTIPSELLLKLREDICEVEKARRDLRHSVILGQGTLSVELCRGLAEGDISGYAAPSECLDTLYSMLCEIMRE